MRHGSLMRLGVALTLVIAVGACRSGPDQAAPASAAASQAPISTQPLYLCCNVRTETDWLSDGGFLVGRIIPAGTPVKHLGTSRSVANVEIDGKRFRLGNEFGVRAEPTEQWLKKVLVTTDPTAKINAYPASVQTALRSGKIARGMSKDQVVIALGHPPAHATGSLDALEWTYMANRWVRYTVQFDQNGRVRDVNAGGWRDSLLLP
ncbi:MAG: outer membrane protein assembly factor BamE [Burkholderiales bacterium]